MPQPGMHGQQRQLASMRGDAAPRVQGTKIAEQGASLGQRHLWRGRQERQIIAAPQRQFQRERGQVSTHDLWRRKGGQGPVLALGPHAIGRAGGDAARAAGALVGLGAADPFRHKPRHAAARIKSRPPCPARIHNNPHVLDRQRRFGDRRRQHDLAPLLHGRNRSALRSKGQGTV